MAEDLHVNEVVSKNDFDKKYLENDEIDIIDQFEFGDIV
jgi:hypothetical protein